MDEKDVRELFVGLAATTSLLVELLDWMQRSGRMSEADLGEVFSRAGDKFAPTPSGMDKEAKDLIRQVLSDLRSGRPPSFLH